MRTTAAFCVTALFLIPSAGDAAGTLDQQYVPTTTAGLIVESSQTLAQSFQVGLSGVFDRVEVLLARNPILPPQGLTLEIRPTRENGAPPTANVLASAPIAAADVSEASSGAFISVSLLSYDLHVTAGQTLALVLRSDAVDLQGGIDPFAWIGDSAGSYSPGAVFVDRGTWSGPSSYDMGFRTYVVVPEPSTLVLALFGAGLLIYGRKNHRLRS